MYDCSDEMAENPFADDADVVGLYPADAAPAASQTSASDQGSGPTKTDD